MNKRYLHHVWIKLRPINYWYFLTAAIISLGIAIYALRQNNLTALRLRDHVLQVDKDNGDIETALRQLRGYIYSHMNASLSQGPNSIKPPIQLKYRYERLVQAQQSQSNTTNAQVYHDAQITCEKLFPLGLSGSGRIPCITDYVTKHGTQPSNVSIPDSLYKFDFVAPLWSPDVAGISLLISGVFFILFFVRFGLERWLKHSLET